ncbi:MAG: hypothetical protein WDN67_02305 [Candidatus Moraniibacteriota bacterium]
MKNKKIFLVFCAISFFLSTSQASAITKSACQTLEATCYPTNILWGDGCYDSETLVGKGCVSEEAGDTRGFCCLDDDKAKEKGLIDQNGNPTSSNEISGLSAKNSYANGLNYTPLENIPFLESTGDFSAYFKGVYQLALVLIVLSAIFMLTVGGFMYLTSAGNTSSVSSAKKVLRDSLLGLVLALAAVLILNIINPDLTNLSIQSLSPVSLGGGGTGSDGGGGGSSGGGSGSFAAKEFSGAQVETDASARTKLQQNGIGVNKANCSSSGQTNCTSLDGIPSSTIAWLIDVKRECGCNLVVTGGTEAGHATHGPGRAAVDIGRNPVLAFMQKQSKIDSSKNRPIYSYRGYKVWDEDSGHFHAWDPAN